VADNAERGVVFTLKANVDPQAKATVEDFSKTVEQAREKVVSAVKEAMNQSATAIAETQSEAAASVQSTAAAVTTATQQTVDYEKSSAAEIAKAWGFSGDAKAASAKQSATVQINEGVQKVVDYEKMSAADIVKSWSVANDSVVQDTVESHKTLKERIQELEAEKADIRRVSAEKERADYIHANLAYVDIVRRRMEEEEKLRIAEEKGSLDAAMSQRDLVMKLKNEEIEIEKEVSSTKEAFRKAEKREKAALVDEQLNDLKKQQGAEERIAAAAISRNEKIGASVGRIVSAFSEGSEALMRFANGFRHLGLVGETDLKKLTDALLTIQGTTQVFTGAIRLIRQASEGYDAYRRVVLLTAEAHQALATAQATSAAVGAVSGATVAGSVATGGAAAVGGSTLGALATTATSAGIGVGAGLGAVGLSTAGMSGIGILTAAGAVIAGLAVDLYAFKELIKEWQKFDFGKGATPGGFVEKAGTSSFNPFVLQAQYYEEIYGEDGMSPGKERDASNKRLKEFAKWSELTRERNLVDERKIEDLNKKQAESAQAKAQAERESLLHRMSAMKIEDRRSEVIKQITDVESNGALNAEQKAKQIIQWSNQRLQIEREISSEQIRSAQQTLAVAKQELQTKEQQIKVAQDAAMSAQERFGMLGVDEQQQLLEARKRFQAGAQNVEVEDLRKLRGFSGAMDEQIAAEARRRAAAAGFGEFQAEDVKRIKALEAERAQIEVKVKAQAQVVAKLEVDAESVAKEINKQIDAQYGIILKSMAEQIGLSSAKIKDLEDNIRNRLTRI
jgi:hypothetical protein